jgi:hypothetical protein
VYCDKKENLWWHPLVHCYEMQFLLQFSILFYETNAFGKIIQKLLDVAGCGRDVCGALFINRHSRRSSTVK